MEKKYWEDKEYAYFSHKKCEYFPCHKGADPEDFNCLFCYCPLYAHWRKMRRKFQIIMRRDLKIARIVSSLIRRKITVM